MKQVSMANDWVIHSHKVIEKLYGLMSDINSSETELRSYFITTDNAYYESYLSALRKIANDVENIKIFTQDDPVVTQKITELGQLIQQRFAAIEIVLSIRRIHSFSYTLKYVNDRKYIIPSFKEMAATISTKTNELISIENKKLEKRNFFAINNFTRATLLAIYGSSASILLMLVCFLVLNRQLFYRDRAEQELLKSEDALKKLAYFDPLTGLANRAIILSNLEQAIQSAKNDGKMVGLVFIDIDNFKDINDSFGHAVGDDLLKGFSRLLQNQAADNKMIFRLSGDEFAVIISNLNHKNDIITFLESILETTRVPIPIHHNHLFITCSMGVSFYPNDGDDGKVLLKTADIAMYRAKKLGKNTYQFCMSNLILEVEERALLEQQLYRAVRQKEFTVVYQPKISLKSGKLSGFEALIRWNISNADLIFPGQFISLAESNGLIVPIGEWVLEAICNQGSEWLAEGINFGSIALNISIREISMHDFIDRVKRILHESSFDPSLLEFEITESILMNNSDKNLSVLRELKELGIKITIDDFGTGYSSLSYLHRFSVDKLKIDQSFISKITNDKHSPVIINAIIGMAHSLGIQVIAEGVENELQLDFLRKYGCDEVQGFYYSYPLTPVKVREFIMEQALFALQLKE